MSPTFGADPASPDVGFRAADEKDPVVSAKDLPPRSWRGSRHKVDTVNGGLMGGANFQPRCDQPRSQPYLVAIRLDWKCEASSVSVLSLCASPPQARECRRGKGLPDTPCKKTRGHVCIADGYRHREGTRDKHIYARGLLCPPPWSPRVRPRKLEGTRYILLLPNHLHRPLNTRVSESYLVDGKISQLAQWRVGRLPIDPQFFLEQRRHFSSDENNRRHDEHNQAGAGSRG